MSTQIVDSEIIDFGLSKESLNLSGGSFASFRSKFPGELYCIYVPGSKLMGGLCNKTEWFGKLNFKDFI